MTYICVFMSCSLHILVPIMQTGKLGAEMTWPRSSRRYWAEPGLELLTLWNLPDLISLQILVFPHSPGPPFQYLLNFTMCLNHGSLVNLHVLAQEH